MSHKRCVDINLDVTKKLLSNSVKQHIKRTHPGKFMQFEENVKASSVRGKSKVLFSSGSCSDSTTSVVLSSFSLPSDMKARQQAIGESFSNGTTGSAVPQAAVD